MSIKSNFCVIAQKNNSYHAVQVCYELNEDNSNRELSGLIEAMDKLHLENREIITIDQEETLSGAKKQIYTKRTPKRVQPFDSYNNLYLSFKL